MPTTTYVEPIYFSGDMMALTPTQPIQTPGLNPGQDGFGMVVENASALGGSDSFYRLVWYQNLNASATEFQNGQFWRVEAYDDTSDSDSDPFNGDAGWSTVYSNLVPKSDLVSGVGGGDEYIVLEIQDGSGRHLFYDINGGLSTTPTDYTLLGVDQNGDAGDGDGDSNLDFFDAYSAFTPPICFCRGTMIDTPQGARAIEDLREGDLVKTADNGAQPVRWIGSRKLSSVMLMVKEDLRPVRIAAGALGNGLPHTTLMVSQQHRVLVRSRIAQRLTGSQEVLVAAKHLCMLDGIDLVDDFEPIEYFHILLDGHELVFSNGAATETLYTGAEALKSLNKAAVQEIRTLFPAPKSLEGVPVAARSLANGRVGKKLAMRHAKNGQLLIN